MEELELIIASAKQEMDAAIKHLDHAFQKIRAGRASTAMVQDVMVEYYGAMTPLSQVANVSIPDAMTISIQPWDKNAIGAIEKAIIVSNLGFAPSNNGENIILNVPPLTEERRKELYKEQKKSGTVRREGKKLYPNDLCHCGSGKKYKKCCMRKDEEREKELSANE